MTYYFDEFSLDTDRRELSHKGSLVAIEPRAFDLLAYLIENRERVVTRDELHESLWAGRIVSDSALSSGVKDARAAVNDTGAMQKWIKTIHGRGFRFVGSIKEAGNERNVGTGDDTRTGNEPLQSIRYCQTADGIRIAYASTGQGPFIVKAANWMSHLEFDFESPIWRHWITGLSRAHQLIRYDERGNGLSDREVQDLSFEAMVADLETVIDALDIEKFALFGISQGCAVSVEYAARYPERVSNLILYGGFVKGWRRAGDPVEIGQRIAMSSLIRTGWGQENPAFRQLFTSRFMPGASSGQMAWFNELQRRTVSPKIAGDLHDIFGSIDVSHRLDIVKAPTLVLHARNDGEIPLASGREFATGIPGARFVTLESNNHILLEHEPAFARFLQEVKIFLKNTL